MHGGIGVTFDHDLHLVLRRIVVNRALYGTPADHRRRLARWHSLAKHEPTLQRDANGDAARRRARSRSRTSVPEPAAWIRTNLPRAAPRRPRRIPPAEWSDEQELAAVAPNERCNAQFFDAGLAGVCVPVEYGGLGPHPAHQQALNEELRGYEYPVRLQSPTMSPCASPCCSTSAPRSRSVDTSRRSSGARRSGCSSSPNRAAAPTSPGRSRPRSATATNGCSTARRSGPPARGGRTGASAWPAPTGTCRSTVASRCSSSRCTRTGVEVHRIEMLNGFKEFCQEFMTDLRVPDSDRVGEVDEGWTIGTRWMFHERMLAHNSPLRQHARWRRPPLDDRGSQPRRRARRRA